MPLPSPVSLIVLHTGPIPPAADAPLLEVSASVPNDTVIEALWTHGHRTPRIQQHPTRHGSWTLSELLESVCETQCPLGQYTFTIRAGEMVLEQVELSFQLPHEAASPDALVLDVQRKTRRKADAHITNQTGQAVWLPPVDRIGVSCRYFDGRRGGGSAQHASSTVLSEQHGTILAPGDTLHVPVRCQLGNKRSESGVTLSPMSAYLPLFEGAPSLYFKHPVVWASTTNDSN